ncbi:MAG: LysR family transcriptional regulator [Rhizobiaceae bacterium]|nr:LysR family transcriptional regulator [Rhizobiaceae bacterium]
MKITPRRLLPSTSALTAFDAVARTGSFTAAAKLLDLTQGAVSRQIAQLEEQLGLTLVEREARGVRLTSKGRTYAEGVAEILSKIRSLSLEAMSANTEMRLRLAIPPTFGTRWLMPRMPDFVERNPGITISFATRIGQFDFRADNIDAAIHVGRPDWPDADCLFLMNETAVPVCTPEFLSAHPIAQAGDLLGLPLLEMASRPGAWRHWFGSLNIAGYQPEGMMFEQFSNVTQACLAGLGVALMPELLIEPELGGGRLVRAFDWAVESESAYYLVRPRHRLDFQPARIFADWLAGETAQFAAS